MKSNSNLNSSAGFQTFNRKKNPRDMTIQELDEYIRKNRQKNFNPTYTESKSLNSSFSSNNHFGLFNENNVNKNNNFNSENRKRTSSLIQNNKSELNEKEEKKENYYEKKNPPQII